MKKTLEPILEECLTRLATGEVTTADCLARYPQHAAELERLLLSAGSLIQAETITAPQLFKTQTRAQLHAYMRTWPRRTWRTRLAGLMMTPTRRLAFSLVVVALVFLLTTTAFAQAAVPGDELYSWKTSSEQVWRAFQPDPLAADLTLMERRVKELEEVAGNEPRLEKARLVYEEALTGLDRYQEPAARGLIHGRLVAQQKRLERAGIRMAALEQFLGRERPAPGGPWRATEPDQTPTAVSPTPRPGNRPTFVPDHPGVGPPPGGPPGQQGRESKDNGRPTAVPGAP